jgi:hypothetical protein
VEPKKPHFGIASLVFAALSVVLPVVIVLVVERQVDRDTHEQAKAWAPLIAVFLGAILSAIAVGVTSLLGTITGGVALARGERQSWLAVVGLVVNVPILAFVAFLVVLVQASRG